MKKALPFLFVLLGLALVAPFIVGGVAKTRFEGGLVGFNTAAASTLQARLVGYERGWFDSNAQLELTLTDAYIAQLQGLQNAGMDAEVLRRPLTLQLAVHHGPLLMQGGPQLGWAAYEAQPDAESPSNRLLALALDAGDGWLTLNAVAGLDGTVDFSLEVVALDTGDGGMFTFQSEPAHLRGRVQGNRFAASFEAPAMTFGTEEVEFGIDGITGEFDYTLVAPSVGIGTTRMGFDRASGMAEGREVFSLDAVTFASDVKLAADGETMLITADYGVAAMQLPNSPAVSEVSLHLAMNGFDLPAVQAFSQRMQSLQQLEDQSQALALLTPELEQLFRNHPSLDLAPIKFLVEGEPFAATIHLSTNPDAAVEPNYADPAFWRTYFMVSADVSAAKPLATNLAAMQLGRMTGGQVGTDQVAGMLAGMVAQGMLVDAGDAYTVAITYEGGVLSVNGNPMMTP